MKHTSRHRRSGASWQSTVFVAALVGFARLAHPQADSDLVGRLVAQLDAERYSQREAAQRRLIEIGSAALPAVIAALDDPSPEVRIRAGRVYDQLHHEALLRDFRRLARGDVAGSQEEYGMYLAARILDPLVERDRIDRRLDELAEAVRAKLAARMIDPKTDGAGALAVLVEVLFVDQGFRGNEAQYDDPANSSIDRVLESRRGLPITLSQMTIAVARRVDLKLVGLSLPRRYMVMYVPPPGRANEERIVDPFAGGATYSLDELEDVLAGLGFGLDPATHLQPAPANETNSRLLRNLAADLRVAGRPAMAARVDQYEALYGTSRSP